MIPVQYRISTTQEISLLSHVKTALAAGCQWIQLKTNGENGKVWHDTMTQIKELCRAQEATFIIENDIELVKSIEGDGIHITDDTSIIEVRQLLGEGFLIGANTVSAEDIIKKKQQSADYLCFGPYAKASAGSSSCPTHTLQDFSKTIAEIEEKEVTLPVCAYGEIATDDIRPLMETGIRGISIALPEKGIDESLVTETLKKYLNL